MPNSPWRLVPGFAAPPTYEHGFSTRQLETLPDRIWRAKQVHGSRVLSVPASMTKSQVATEEADALVCAEPGIPLGIVTADCLPVLFQGAKGSLGAAHAGWRGLAAGVLENTVRALSSEYSEEPQNLRVAIGPAIGLCCFQVGPEVEAAFAPRIRECERFFKADHGDRKRADLRGLARFILENLGIPADQIFDVPDCTFCKADLYVSYRRAKGGACGRQISYVGRFL